MVVRPLCQMKLHSSAEQALKHQVRAAHKILFQQQVTVVCKGWQTVSAEKRCLNRSYLVASLLQLKSTLKYCLPPLLKSALCYPIEMKATNNSEEQIINAFCCGPVSSFETCTQQPFQRCSYTDPKVEAEFSNIASSLSVSFYDHL